MMEMEATLYFVAWWKHAQPAHIMAGPFTDPKMAVDEATRLQMAGSRCAVPIRAQIPLTHIEILHP